MCSCDLTCTILLAVRPWYSQCLCSSVLEADLVNPAERKLMPRRARLGDLLFPGHKTELVQQVKQQIKIQRTRGRSWREGLAKRL